MKLYRIIAIAILVSISVVGIAQVTNQTTLTVQSGLVITNTGETHVTSTGFINNAGTWQTRNWNNEAVNGGISNNQGMVHFGIQDTIKGTVHTAFYDLGSSSTNPAKWVAISEDSADIAFEVNNTMNLDAAGTEITMNNRIAKINNSASSTVTNASFYTSLDQQAGNIQNIPYIDWAISDQTGTYQIDFKYENTNTIGTLVASADVSLLYSITSAGDAGGNIVFSSVGTDFMNTPYIDGISNVTISGNDESTSAINRFWLIDASTYTSQPTANITFDYEVGNDLCGDALCALIDPNTFAGYQWDGSSSWGPMNYPTTVNQTNQTLTIIDVDNANGWFSFADKCSNFSVDAGSDITCAGPLANLNATPTNGIGTVTYSWSPSDSLSCTSCQSPSTDVNYTTTYMVTATDGVGCQTNDDVIVNIDAFQHEVCMVTVDTTSTKNMVVWEKPIVTTIDSFFVYRMNTLSVFEKIGAVHYDSLSQYVDEDPLVNPNQQQYDYKISVLDNCGVEGLLSDFHRTIYMNIPIFGGSQTDINWIHYQGFTSAFQYEIYRDTVGNNNWELIGTVASAVNAFMDLSPPIDVSSARYNIRIVIPGGSCDATKAESYGSTRSNKQTIAGNGGTVIVADFGETNTNILTTESVIFNDLTFGNPPASQWTWSFPGGTPNVSTDQNPIVTYNNAGIYDVTLIASNGSDSDTLIKTALIHVGNAGLEELIEINSFLLYPNPTNSAITIQLGMKDGLNNLDLELLDLKGKVIKKTQFSKVGNINHKIDLNEFAPGVYLMRVTTKSGSIVKRIVKQ
jgi:PKD repeat protein